MSNPRSLARRCGVQAIYQWQLSGSNLLDIENQFIEELGAAQVLYRRYKAGQFLSSDEQSSLEELLERYCRMQPQGEHEENPELKDLVEVCCPPDIQLDYFKALLHGIPEKIDQLDATLAEFTDRPVAEIDPVERAILRLGTYELMFRPELPYRVAVNEAINLGKCFGSSQSHKYINGILDRVARKHRAPEAAASRR